MTDAPQNALHPGEPRECNGIPILGGRALHSLCRNSDIAFVCEFRLRWTLATVGSASLIGLVFVFWNSLCCGKVMIGDVQGGRFQPKLVGSHHLRFRERRDCEVTFGQEFPVVGSRRHQLPVLIHFLQLATVLLFHPSALVSHQFAALDPLRLAALLLPTLHTIYVKCQRVENLRIVELPCSAAGNRALPGTER